MDPRQVVLEWFAENIYAYEESLSARKYKREPLQALIAAIKKTRPAQEGEGDACLSGQDEPERPVFDAFADLKNAGRDVDQRTLADEKHQQGSSLGQGLPATTDRRTGHTLEGNAGRQLDNPQVNEQQSRTPENVVYTPTQDQRDVDEASSLS